MPVDAAAATRSHAPAGDATRDLRSRVSPASQRLRAREHAELLRRRAAIAASAIHCRGVDYAQRRPSRQ